MLLCFKVFGQLAADFSANQTQGCAPLLVQFTNMSTGSYTSVLWSFGNGNTSTLTHPGASYIVPGVYSVSLTISNGITNNTKTRTNFITVFPKPVANFTSTPNSGCAPLPVYFTDSSKVVGSSITNWSWDFGDGGFSNLKNPVNNYVSTGNYKVSLVVTDGHGCSANISKTGLINVVSKPVADFTSDVNFGCDPPLTVHYMSTVSPAGSNSYLWDFGNGNTSTAAHPTNIYTQATNATVKLLVWNSQQCTTSMVKSNYIQFGNISPNFIMGPNPVLCAPATISIFNTTFPVITGITYEWYVNNVLSGTGTGLQLNGLQTGTYSVKLKVKVGGCERSVEKLNFFTVNPKPKSFFRANQTDFCKTPAFVQFSDSSISAISRYWNFGNGQTSAILSPGIFYNQFGKFDVTLITTHMNGCRDTLIKKEYIRVLGPNVTLVINPKSGCKSLPVNFSIIDSTASQMNNFTWTFGDPLSSWASTKSAQFTYLDTGTYPVTLIATNSSGCIIKKLDTVRVGLTQTPDFNAIKRVYCFSDQPVIIQNLTDSILPGTQWLWNFGAGDYSLTGGFAGKYTYKDTGLFSITLHAIHNGCVSSVTKANYIKILAPIPSFIYTQTPCAKTPIVFTNTSIGGTLFSWNFGDGNTYIGKNATHTYQTSGTFIVTLTVTDITTGCTGVVRDTIITDFMVEPSFTQSLSVGCAPLTLVLTNTSTPLSNIASCYFTVNSSTYPGNTVSVPFKLPGVYDIKMTITDLKGCTIPYLKKQAVQIAGVQTNIILDPYFACAPIIVQAYDSSKSDLKIIRRVWHWGNGDSTVYTHNDSIFSRYQYNQGPLIQSDGYFVRLFLTDSMGCKFSTQRKIYISRPMPDFATKTFKMCEFDSMVFTPVNDNLIGLAPIAFRWTILEQTYTDRIVFKKFSGDTNIAVKLYVKDVYACTDSIVKNVNVSTGYPDADFYATPTSVNCPGPPVHFYDQSKGKTSPIVSWEWEFGDGGKSTLQNPSRIYLLPGSYSVYLTVKDSIGCSASKTFPDFILIGGPRGDYSFSPKRGCTPLKVEFNSLAANVAKYEWDLADGTIDTNRNLFHTYLRPGIYIPNLTLTDSTGCKVGLPPIDSIVILPNPQPDFTLSKYVSCLNSNIVFQETINHSVPIVKWNWLIDTVVYSTPGPIVYLANKLGSIDASLKVTDTEGCTGLMLKKAILNVFKDSVNNDKPFIYRATVENDQEVKLELRPATEPDFDHYILYSNFSGGIPLSQKNIDVQADTLQLFTQLNTLQNTYTYRLQTVDVCNNFSVMSRQHTTVELKAIGRLNAVELNWSAYAGWDSVKAYSIYRYNDNNAKFDSIGEVSGHLNQYFDSATYCNKVLYYKVKAKAKDYKYNQTFSWSDTAAAIPILVSEIPQTRSLRATVLNNKDVLLQWFGRSHKYPFTFIIQRKSQDPINQDLTIELNARDTFFVDTKVDVQRYSYTYFVYLKDICGSLSLASNMAKTILLKAEIEGNDHLTADPVINWNAYEAWSSGIKNYELFFKYDSLSNFSSIASRNADEALSVVHPYIDFKQDDYCYQVIAYQQDSDWNESWSNIACVTTSPRLFAPNAITINGDALNEGFKLRGVFIKSYQLRIWDRWGTLLFETTDINEAWDGTYQGQPMPSGVFVFEAFGYGKKGKYKSVKGNVTILR
ncbi:MAG: PKD domain-containing protein [Bacteroidota bacterium]|nr:PKD domain-containing protein [Bacteroidota bacterium]